MPIWIFRLSYGPSPRWWYQKVVRHFMVGHDAILPQLRVNVKFFSVGNTCLNPSFALWARLTKNIHRFKFAFHNHDFQTFLKSWIKDTTFLVADVLWIKENNIFINLLIKYAILAFLTTIPTLIPWVVMSTFYYYSVNHQSGFTKKHFFEIIIRFFSIP